MKKDENNKPFATIYNDINGFWWTHRHCCINYNDTRCKFGAFRPIELKAEIKKTGDVIPIFLIGISTKIIGLSLDNIYKRGGVPV